MLLWRILYLPEAEFLQGTGNVSCVEGFYEQLYCDYALFTTREAAQDALDYYFQFDIYRLYKYSSIPQHYEITQYESKSNTSNGRNVSAT